jgi:hypothetical protein
MIWQHAFNIILFASTGCHAYESLFRRQRDAGTVLGPEGLDWPREDSTAPNQHGLNYMPDVVREQFAGKRTADGKMWPRPELIKVTPGDAVVVLHSCPHGASINTTADPRCMIYFRVTSPLRTHALGSPSAVCSVEALVDIWSEWKGLMPQVAVHRLKQQQAVNDRQRTIAPGAARL